MTTDPSAWVTTSNDLDVEKHKSQRVENGFSTYDWWNFNDYLAWVNIQGLEKFRAEGAGYPGDLTVDSWNDLLDIMIEGFKAHLSLTNMDYFDWANTQEENHLRAKALGEKRKVGLKIYAERFPSLWD